MPCIHVTQPPEPLLITTLSTAHVEGEFAKLVSQRIKSINSQFRRKMESGRIDTIIRSCCDQFRQQILPEFRNLDDQGWTVNYDVPQGESASLQGRLTFSNQEIRMCFAPSIQMLRQMLHSAVEELRESVLYGKMASVGLSLSLILFDNSKPLLSYCSTLTVHEKHVLVAGAYAKSNFLTASLREALEDARRPTELGAVLLQMGGGEDVYALGALSHAKSC